MNMLTFEADGHVYRWHGVEVPSVTQILRALDLDVDLSRADPAAVEAARIRGAWVHQAVHYVDDGDLDRESIPENIRGYVAAYERFLDESGYRALGCEERVYSPRLNYAGTLDKRGLFGRSRVRRVLIDVKTPLSLAMAPVKVQLEAYRLAFNDEHPDEPIDEVAALQLREDGTYRYKRCDDARAHRVWIYAVRAHYSAASPAELDELEDWRADHKLTRRAA